MKKWIGRLTGRQWKWVISGAVSFLLFLILFFTAGILEKKPYAQQLADRWADGKGVAQISVFLSTNAVITEERVVEFGHYLDNALIEAAITNESENPSARLWISAYSANGKITVSSNKGTITASALGVGGDFFQFHPLKLIYGSYFAGSDLVKDRIIIDEDAAWQLFGSNDVVGQYVNIGGVPHIISGVIRRESDKMARDAGLTETLVYVSYDTLQKYGTQSGINCFELLMPNPVKNYAYNYVSEQIGVDEGEREIIENTKRFDTLEKLKFLASFPTRSMNAKAIIYPFWENIARGYEDILTLLFVFEILFLLYPIVLLVVLIVRLWKKRTWHWKDIRNWLSDRQEQFRQFLKNRKARKEKEEEEELL